MPGFIDGAPPHQSPGPNEKAQMQAHLEAGLHDRAFPAAAGDATSRCEITSRQGRSTAPRIIPSGQLRLEPAHAESARAEIRKMAAMGIKFHTARNRA
jgi:hypothetical protein